MRIFQIIVTVGMVGTAACSDHADELASRTQAVFDCRDVAQRFTCDPAPANKRFICHANANDYVKIAVPFQSAHQPGAAHGNHVLADALPGASANDNGGLALDCECRPRICDSVCSGASDGVECDDGDPCTRNGACSGGQCTSGDAVCEAGEFVDACTQLTGACSDAVCATTPVGCPDDGDACTAGSCDPILGCLVSAVVCGDDGDACTVESCDPSIGCTTTPLVCADDGNVCTTEQCDAQLGCTSTPNADACDDGDPSTINDVCSSGTCAGAPLCATQFSIGDDFERADNEVVGPLWSSVQGDVDVSGGAAIMDAGAAVNSWVKATQPQVASYTDTKVRYKLRLGHGINWVSVGFNAVDGPATWASGITLVFYGNAGDDYLRLFEDGVLRAEHRPAGNLAGVDYFVSLTVSNGIATAVVSTGGYAGPAAYTLGPVALAGTAQSNQLRIGLDTNAQATPRLDEVFLESTGTACQTGCIDQRILTVGASANAIRMEGSVANHVVLAAGTHTATVTGDATTGGGGIHPWVIARYPRTGGGGFELLPRNATSTLGFEEAGPLYGFLFDQWNSITFHDNGGTHTVATDGGSFTVHGVSNTFLLDDTVAARISIPAGDWRVEVTGDAEYALGRSFGRVMIGAYPAFPGSQVGGHAMVDFGTGFDFTSLGYGGDSEPHNVFAFFADYGDFSDNTGAATLRFCRR